MSTVWGRLSPQSSDSQTRRWSERALMRTSPRGYGRFETSRLTLYGRPSAATANQDSLDRRRKALGSLRNARLPLPLAALRKINVGGPCLTRLGGRIIDWRCERARDSWRCGADSHTPARTPKALSPPICPRPRTCPHPCCSITPFDSGGADACHIGLRGCSCWPCCSRSCSSSTSPHADPASVAEINYQEIKSL